jgi:hypothetical protein
MADVLFYFSSFYGQEIINIVAESINAEHRKFTIENPEFKGKVSFVTHSLGPIIIYDILANQPNAQDPQSFTFPAQETHSSLVYPKLDFIPSYQFSLRSPLAATLVMRGQDFNSYRLPKPTQFFNIFKTH